MKCFDTEHCSKLNCCYCVKKSGQQRNHGFEAILLHFQQITKIVILEKITDRKVRADLGVAAGVVISPALFAKCYCYLVNRQNT